MAALKQFYSAIKLLWAGRDVVSVIVLASSNSYRVQKKLFTAAIVIVLFFLNVHR